MREFETVCRNLFGSPLVVVDIGAAGGVTEIQGLGPLCEIHAVEPRMDAFRDLEKTNTKRSYAKLFSYDKGLAKIAGMHTLYVTTTPEASSLYRPNAPLIKRWRRDGAFDVVSEVQIDCITLEQMLAQAGISRVDLIKMDTQGSELDILLSARDYIGKISIIKCELEFVELYESQPLFDDVVRELSQRGFRFIDFFDGATLHGKRIWGDSIFIRKRFDDRDSLIKAAAILVEMAYYEEAKWLLLDHGEKPETSQLMINAHVSEHHPNAVFFSKINSVLKNIGKKSPFLEKIRRLLVGALARAKVGSASSQIK